MHIYTMWQPWNQATVDEVNERLKEKRKGRASLAPDDN